MGRTKGIAGLNDKIARFYEFRREQGFIPSDLALQCLKNEYQRQWKADMIAVSHRPKDGEPRVRKPAKTKKPPAAVRQVEVKPACPAMPVKATPARVPVDDRPPLQPIRLTYFDVMARRAL